MIWIVFDMVIKLNISILDSRYKLELESAIE